MLKEPEGPKPKIIAVLKAYHKVQFLCNPPVVITSQPSLLVFLSKMAEPTLYSTAVLSKCAILVRLPLLWRKLFAELNQDHIHWTRKKFQNPPKIHNNQVKQPSAGAKERQSLPQTWPVWGEGDKGFPYWQPGRGCRAHLLQTCPQSWTITEHPDNLISQSKTKKRRARRTKSTHMFSSPSYLQKQIAALCTSSQSRQLCN